MRACLLYFDDGVVEIVGAALRVCDFHVSRKVGVVSLGLESDSEASNEVAIVAIVVRARRRVVGPGVVLKRRGEISPVVDVVVSAVRSLVLVRLVATVFVVCSVIFAHLVAVIVSACSAFHTRLVALHTAMRRGKLTVGSRVVEDLRIVLHSSCVEGGAKGCNCRLTRALLGF